jgi:hypothetical protein
MTEAEELATQAMPDETALVEEMARNISAVTHHTYGWSEVFARAALPAIRPHIAALQARAALGDKS